MNRIVAILDPPYMFGETERLGHLQVPEDMDLPAEQAKWMTLGTDPYRNFYDYLLAQPDVEPFHVEDYYCQYQ